GTRWAAWARGQAGSEFWHDPVTLGGTGTLATALVSLGDLPVGAGRFEIGPVGAAPAAARGAPFLVSFSDQWAITNYDQMISLLRYFDRPQWVDSLRKASPEERPAVWRRFYKSTDPVSLTPENEALDRYFRRIQVPNQ